MWCRSLAIWKCVDPRGGQKWSQDRWRDGRPLRLEAVCVYIRKKGKQKAFHEMRISHSWQTERPYRASSRQTPVCFCRDSWCRYKRGQLASLSRRVLCTQTWQSQTLLQKQTRSCSRSPTPSQPSPHHLYHRAIPHSHLTNPRSPWVSQDYEVSIRQRTRP